jgi:outer membrane lipoprotein-sorting protein
VERAVAALRAISSMRADFVQTDRNGQRLTGTLTLQRPGKIRFQYQPGVPLLIVSDGAALTVIDYEVRQVSRWPIRNSPLGALLNPDKDVARYARLLPTTNPDVLSLEIKDPRHPEYGTLTLIMVRKPGAPGGLQLDSWVALDSQNQRTTIACPTSNMAYRCRRTCSATTIRARKSATDGHRSQTGNGSSSLPDPVRHFANNQTPPFIGQQADQA